MTTRSILSLRMAWTVAAVGTNRADVLVGTPVAADGGVRIEVATAATGRGRALGPLAAPAPPSTRPG
jgi:hypothetical protein